ncbi:trihelix transcription factor GT-2-like [Phalaenopsis equestris]|uniref:trihelix transcription factor GT-2-like n=1 Tax=Phalaenopsis equestris TaxID=78828 RepID=UPI0009E22D1B|nr:trihelix transcription factor GT-2-like [Phalaenopsis equestris]
MHSGFGGVSEIQQFMVDGSTHSFFSISSNTPPTPNSVTTAGHEIYHPAAVAPANRLINTFYRHPSQYSQPTPPPPPHFPHFNSNIPITQQLFTPPPQPRHHHHFQLFQSNQHDHRRLLDHEHDQENSVGGPPHFLTADMKFKLAVDDSSCSGSRHTFNNDNDIPGGILHDENASDSRLRSWHKEESCAIKEPFWRPLDLDYINSNNKRCKDKESAELNFAQRSRVTEELENSHPGNNYKLFSELEAIYKPGGSNSTATEPANNNQTTTHAANQTTGSGSALTGDDHPLIPPVTAAFDLDYRLEDDNSTGGEAQTNLKKAQHHSRRCRRRRRRKMKSIAAFFEGLLKQLMGHQEALHQKFLNVMEQRDKERVGQEELRREQEASRARREAVARAHDRELAAARESAILCFLEKITGETINLPSYPNVSSERNDAVDKEGDFISPPLISTSRWPKIEVQALIQVRSELDGQFQEPGLKGPLWEEVSAAMTAMGYHRSAKRCKEKWENINKYFRKSKESGRKRSQHSKTCPYFHQLDQLYSNDNGRKRKNSELLDAVVVTGVGEEVGDSEGRRTAAEEAEREDEEVDDESSQFVEQLQ